MTVQRRERVMVKLPDVEGEWEFHYFHHKDRVYKRVEPKPMPEGERLTRLEIRLAEHAKDNRWHNFVYELLEEIKRSREP